MNFKKVFETPKNSNYFFGYYDKSPICMQDKRHLALKTNFYNRVPKWGDKASIGFLKLISQTKYSIKFVKQIYLIGNKLICSNGMEINQII